MSFTQIVGKLDESRNLNTSPFTVSGLKGDQFDYSFMIFCDAGGAISNTLHEINFNSDTGNNYENHDMEGLGTAKSVGNTTGDSKIYLDQFQRNNSNRNSLCVGAITGDSSQDRIIKTLFCCGQPRLANTFGIWTNNVDELTSITFKSGVSASYKWHIVVFEVPKVGNDDQWELIDTLSWSASATEQSFTDLEGDIDEQYLIDWDGQAANLHCEINNDASSIYTRQVIQNTGSAFQATNATTESKIRVRQSGSCIINALTGVDRTATAFDGADGSNKHSIESYWYRNTATEMTSLYCTPSASSTAKAKLYRRKNPKIPADMFRLPFEFVDSIDVDSADFTTGESFTGLEGDKVLMYRLEFNGVNTSNTTVQTNGDTGASDYAYQVLRGTGTAESAGSDTAHLNIFLTGDSNGDVANSVTYIYPKSGEYRPCLSYSMIDEDQIDLFASWRLDTADEITSLLVSTTASGQITGKFTLSAIYL